jgi:superkiller protein 3
LEFSTRLFKRSDNSTGTEEIIPAFFALERYVRKVSDDACALHLLGLVCERLGHLELGIERTSEAIAILEAEYERSEDPLIERRFVVANTSMGRLRLGTGAYAAALEAFTAALGLLPEELEASDAEGKILKSQCQFGGGLAYFKMGQLAEALGLFEAALATAGEDIAMKGQITVLLAQTLWALGSEEGRESAKSQLLQWYAQLSLLTHIHTQTIEKHRR